MLDLYQLRCDLLETLGRLNEAHAALLAEDTRAAVIAIETAQGALAEIRKQLPSIAAAGYGNPPSEIGSPQSS